MKNGLLIIFLAAGMFKGFSQVTRLSNNTSYDVAIPISQTKIILRSSISNTLWVYDVPGNTFTQLSATVTVLADYDYGVMAGKLYFAGNTGAAGIELWVTDGTTGGTVLLKDINPGAGSSTPEYGFQVYSNDLFFTASDGTNGRELWKTDGTGGGTVLVKDINTGAADAFTSSIGGIPTFSIINNLLIFTAVTAADGQEPWKTDGTGVGTTQLVNINATAGGGSSIAGFTQLGTNLLFTAKDGNVNGETLWKTDGSVGGTAMVKDLNPITFDIVPTIILTALGEFQNELYFTGDDGTAGFELWKTNGTTAGTVLVKDIEPGPDPSTPALVTAKTASKFFFSAATSANGRELWESDGTGTNTVLFKDFATGVDDGDPAIAATFGPLFLGDKFFITATTAADGEELYVSDGTIGGTVFLGNINAGAANGITADFIYFYTTTKFFFTADNTTNGEELWQSDGTAVGVGTTLVQDINATPATASSNLEFATLVSNKLFFFGTDGDDPTNTDFFSVDGSFSSLPLRWLNVQVKPVKNDVQVSWETAAEENTDYFSVQRSADGINFIDAGTIKAKGSGSNKYQFTDAGSMKYSGVRKWYYRIKSTDIDGKAFLSKVLTITPNGLAGRIKIMPNPVNRSLNIMLVANENYSAQVRIVDIHGKILYQRTVVVKSGENTIITDVNRLKNGVYMLQVVADGSSLTEKFMISR